MGSGSAARTPSRSSGASRTPERVQSAGRASKDRRRSEFVTTDTLESAIANAENNHQLDVDKLVVARAEVGRAVVMKRFHARARGRGARILKPFANLTIVVREQATETA